MKKKLLMSVVVAVLSGSAALADSSNIEKVSAEGEASFATPPLSRFKPARRSPQVVPVGFWDQPGGFPGNEGSRRRLACISVEDGFEEHWGGHGGQGFDSAKACAACKKKHGSCTFKCAAPAYRCTARWVTGASGPSASSRPPRSGRELDNIEDALESALGRCLFDHWRDRADGDCQVDEQDCKDTERTTSSGPC